MKLAVGCHGKGYTFIPLQSGNHGEWITGVGIEPGPQYTRRFPGAFVHLFSQGFKADGGVDIIARQQFPDFKLVVKRHIPRGAGLCGHFEIFC